ncbi:unnamed protein product, partial [Didymodactylos carnosus]
LGLLIKDLSKTRWSDRYNSIRAVLISYKEIVETLDDLSVNDKQAKSRFIAGNLLKKLKSFTFYTILLFLKNLFSSINALIIHLQKPQMDILTTIDILNDKTKLLDQLSVDNVNMDSILKVAENDLSKLNVKVDLDEEFVRIHRRTKTCASIQEYFRTIFSRILSNMNEEFKDYLTTLSEKLKWFAHLSPKFIHLFSMNDAKELQKIVPTLDDGELLFSELQLLKLKISNCIDMNEACDLMKRNNGYPQAQLVFKYLLTIPVSIATNERSFSKLKIILEQQCRMKDYFI